MGRVFGTITIFISRLDKQCEHIINEEVYIA